MTGVGKNTKWLLFFLLKSNSDSLIFLPLRIIEKCATVMKGECFIKFEKSRTVFTLDISAKPFVSTNIKTSIDIKTFRLPPETWGFCIDDSKIQQKLMVSEDKYMSLLPTLCI